MRRLRARLDCDALDAAIGSFLSVRTSHAGKENELGPIAMAGA
ncbi:hypothetical protein [Streptomyces sp. JH14]|nr:hypothetical protein [Streptomyces sp. JH14]